MIEQSITITILGMGSVFFFLILLVCFMNLLSLLSKETKSTDMNKKALAIVLALHGKKGK